MLKPLQGTYPPYLDNYIHLVAENDVLSALKAQEPIIQNFFKNISEAQSNIAYAEGKWTIKELLQHCIDTERIFCYRALCFARKESASLPGFDENKYTFISNANTRKWEEICKEMAAVRNSTTCLFESFTDEMLTQSGLANHSPVTVLAIGFACVGHLYHHKKVIEEKYLLTMQ